MSSHIRWLMRSLVAAVLLCPNAAAQEPAAGAPHSVPGWYLGMPVLLTARSPSNNLDRRQLPSMRVYVTAPVSDTAGTAPMKTVPLPDGEVVLPPHQNTLTSMASEMDPLLAIGYFVEIGPKGTESNVRIQRQPENAWPSRPLASEIRIGTDWVRLNNHVVIEYGLKKGLLQLEFFDVGGLMWGRHFDGGTGDAPLHECFLSEPPPAPPVDWLRDTDHVPGQNPKQGD